MTGWCNNPICWNLPSIAMKHFLLVSKWNDFVSRLFSTFESWPSHRRSVISFWRHWILVLIFLGWTPTVVSQWRLHVLHRYFQLNASVFLRKFRSSLLGWNLADENVLWVNYNDFTWKRWVQKSPFIRFRWWDIYVLFVFFILGYPRSSMPATTMSWSVTCLVLGNHLLSTSSLLLIGLSEVWYVAQGTFEQPWILLPSQQSCQ